MTEVQQSGLRAWSWAGAVGAALVGSAAFNAWSSARAKLRYPPIGKFIEVDGVRLHYLDRGAPDAASTVVLLHGSGALIQDFVTSGLVDRLAERHRVIVFDRPGYGYSDRPRDRSWTPEAQAAALVAACAQLGVVRPLVVGHSWGTLPALARALDHPAALSGLVLISGYYFFSPRADAIPTLIAASPVVGDLLSHTLLPLQTRITGPAGLRMVFSPAEPPQRMLDEMPFELMLRPEQLHATAADSGQMPIAAGRLQTRYGELTLPVAILWSEGDALVRQGGQSARLAQTLPHALTKQIDDAGHMMHHIYPDAVVAVIKQVAA